MASKRARTAPQLDVVVRHDDVLDIDEAAEVIPFNYTVTAYGADYPVDGLIKRISAKDILVPLFSRAAQEQHSVVGFQREYVWSKLQADRFIESLLLGLPVPGIFLVKEPSNVLLVLDGHQRLKTLHGFYENVWNGGEFFLETVQDRFTGLRYTDLEPEDRRRIDNSIIHATIVRQDEPSEDQSSIYLVFERLNSGGTSLQPQEIRVALYHGEFVAVLSSLNEDVAWRALYGRKSKRLKDVELVLRFFAFLFYADDYARPMKGFLNRYMAANRHLARQSKRDLTHIFTQTVETIRDAIGEKAFRPQGTVNAAVADAVMVGVARRIQDRGAITSKRSLSTAYAKLIERSRFKDAIARATADEESVKQRLALATKAFAKVP